MTLADQLLALPDAPLPPPPTLRRALWRKAVDAGASPVASASRSTTTAGVDDDTLLAAFVAGSAPAFTTLYERHAPRLYGYAVRQLGLADAEDAVAGAFEALLHKAPTVDAGALRRWLNGALRVELLRRLSERARREVPTDEIDPAGPDAAAALLARFDLARLAEVLHDTDVLTQEIAVRLAHGATAPEIAAALDLQPPAIRKRIERLRALLSDALEPR